MVALLGRPPGRFSFRAGEGRPAAASATWLRTPLMAAPRVDAARPTGRSSWPVWTGGRLLDGRSSQSMEVSQMQSMTRAAHTGRHFSRHERQRQARAEAFWRRTPAESAAPAAVELQSNDLALIDRLVRQDRTAVSSALLAIPGIGGGERVRKAVLASVAETTRSAQAEGAISATRSAQIARHVKRGLARVDQKAGRVSAALPLPADSAPQPAGRRPQPRGIANFTCMPYRTVDRRLGRARRRRRAVRRSETKVG